MVSGVHELCSQFALSMCYIVLGEFTIILFRVCANLHVYWKLEEIMVNWFGTKLKFFPNHLEM